MRGSRLLNYMDLSHQGDENTFKNSRMAYTRYLTKRKHCPSGSGRSEVPIPPEFGNVDWRVSYSKHHPTSSNVPQGVQLVNEPSSDLASNSSGLDNGCSMKIQRETK